MNGAIGNPECLYPYLNGAISMGWFDELKKQSPNLGLYEQLVENRERLDEKLDEYLQHIENDIKVFMSHKDDLTEQEARKLADDLYAPIIGDIKAAIVENENTKKRIMDKAMGREE